MSGETADPDLITVDEYLEGEELARVKHEYVDGRVFAMAGASRNHGLIVGNRFAAIHGHLRGGPCQVFSSDMKVYANLKASQRFYYPDIVTSCDPADRHPKYLEKPAVVIEVLSDSTWREDRGEKLGIYQNIASVDEVALVAQSWSEVNVYRRTEGWERIILHRASDTLGLDSQGFAMELAAIYEGVVFPGEVRMPWYLRDEPE